MTGTCQILHQLCAICSSQAGCSECSLLCCGYNPQKPAAVCLCHIAVAAAAAWLLVPDALGAVSGGHTHAALTMGATRICARNQSAVTRSASAAAVLAATRTELAQALVFQSCVTGACTALLLRHNQPHPSTVATSACKHTGMSTALSMPCQACTCLAAGPVLSAHCDQPLQRVWTHLSALSCRWGPARTKAHAGWLAVGTRRRLPAVAHGTSCLTSMRRQPRTRASL